MSLLHQQLMQTMIVPSPPTMPQDDNASASPTSNGRFTSFDVGTGKFYFILLQTQSHALFLVAGMGDDDDDNDVDYLATIRMEVTIDLLIPMFLALSLMMKKIPSRLVMPDLRKKGLQCLAG